MTNDEKGTLILGIVCAIALAYFAYLIGYERGFDECFIEMSHEPKRIIFQSVD